MRDENHDTTLPLLGGGVTEGTVLLIYVHKESGEEKQNQTIWGRNGVN